LVKNGWSEETAIEMDHTNRAAIAIILGQLEGNEFDWHFMRWKERSK
jgi:hypothetical protein